MTVLMNFSGIYHAEGFFPDGAEVIDFSDLDGTTCYCDPHAASIIRSRVGPYGYNGIHWLDSGDYHYASLFWMEMVDIPFAVVLIDNHSDDQDVAFDSSLLSCGSWMNEVKGLPMLSEKDGLKAAFHILHPDGPGLAALDALFPGVPVYLSIDKDVMRWEDARTDWDQGDMTLDELKDVVSCIVLRHKILGVDVCGELSGMKGAVDIDLITNARTNRILQDFLLNLKI